MIIEKIFALAHANPGKIALFDRGQAITYGEFAYWIARARDYFIGQNLRPGSLAVLMEVPCRLDGWAFNIALRSLGITTMSVMNLDELNELGVRNIACVITKSKDPVNIRSVAGGYTLIRIVDGVFGGKPAGAVPNLPPIASPAGGHIMLTSGATGTRKKVLVDPARISTIVARHSGVYSITRDSIVNVFAYSLWSGLGFKVPLCTWSTGGCVVFYQEPEPHRSLTVDGITHAFLTPVELTGLLRAPEDRIRRNEQMKLFVTGGPLTRALASPAKRLLTPQVFTYVASTEVGPWTLTPIERLEDLRSHVIHPSVDVGVVDEADRPLPAGQVGAVRIRAADGVTGYLDDEAASRRVFRDLYFYPGDLGEFQANGRLVLHGRFTNVLNMSGDKVSAEPIERALQEKLAVEDVCVLSIPAGDAGEDLHIAIQTQRSIARNEIDDAVSGLAGKFASVRVHFFRELPRVGMGKVDRITLRRQICAMGPQV